MKHVYVCIFPQGVHPSPEMNAMITVGWRSGNHAGKTRGANFLLANKEANVYQSSDNGP